MTEIVEKDTDLYELSDDELTERFKQSIRLDQEICRIKKLPICKYDHEKKLAYLEYPDGRREYE